jgi:acyl-CoA thioesterase-1
MCLWLISSAGMAYSAPKTVLVVGDSLSAEYGLPRGAGWVALLTERLRDKKMNVEVVNASISGDTTSGAVSRIAALLNTHRPDVVIIELGGNDGLRGLSLQATEQNFRTLIKDCQDAKARVLLIGMQLPPNYGRSYTEQFRTLFKTISSEQHVALVPFLLEGIAEHPDLFQADRIHVIAAAHPRILENVWPYFCPLISGK